MEVSLGTKVPSHHRKDVQNATYRIVGVDRVVAGKKDLRFYALHHTLSRTKRAHGRQPEHRDFSQEEQLSSRDLCDSEVFTVRP